MIKISDSLLVREDQVRSVQVVDPKLSGCNYPRKVKAAIRIVFDPCETHLILFASISAATKEFNKIEKILHTQQEVKDALEK